MKKMIRNFMVSNSRKARDKRKAFFLSRFEIDRNTKILDLGSENGAYLNQLLANTQVDPKNVYIADIDREAVNKGSLLFGYNAVHLGEAQMLPFTDKYFDIIFCSSVIEHVTIPKKRLWEPIPDAEFKQLSLKRQCEFASEIKRVGRQYFVQTPYKGFLIESHTWLPFVGWFPRGLQLLVIKYSNRFWVKSTQPDWNLLDKNELMGLFDGAILFQEQFLGMTKSIIAIKTCSE